jgi:hypothetical protein
MHLLSGRGPIAIEITKVTQKVSYLGREMGIVILKHRAVPVIMHRWQESSRLLPGGPFRRLTLVDDIWYNVLGTYLSEPLQEVIGVHF